MSLKGIRKTLLKNRIAVVKIPEKWKQRDERFKLVSFCPICRKTLPVMSSSLCVQVVTVVITGNRGLLSPKYRFIIFKIKI